MHVYVHVHACSAYSDIEQAPNCCILNWPPEPFFRKQFVVNQSLLTLHTTLRESGHLRKYIGQDTWLQHGSKTLMYTVLYIQMFGQANESKYKHAMGKKVKSEEKKVVFTVVKDTQIFYYSFNPTTMHVVHCIFTVITLSPS